MGTLRGQGSSASSRTFSVSESTAQSVSKPNSMESSRPNRNIVTKKGLSTPSRASAQVLSRAIFAADSPEQMVAALPAETLYCVLRAHGISSSADLIELLSPDQLRSCLDFDLWQGDRLSETSFFEWLELPDAAGELSILEQLLRSLDLRLLGVLVARYVAVRVFDEPTDAPPGDGFVTPDKGFTWIKIGFNDALQDGEGSPLSPHQEFLAQRLLALIFDTSAELFYQILAIPSVATPSQLEEEAFQDRNKRLQSLGIPDQEFAAFLNTPRSSSEMVDAAPAAAIDHITIEAIDPLLAAAALAGGLPSESSDDHVITDEQAAELDAEVTLLINSALVHFNRDWHDSGQLEETSRFVAGSIRIGVEALKEHGVSSREAIRLFGCQGCYSVGLWELTTLRRKALRVPAELLVPSRFDSETIDAIEMLKVKMPMIKMSLLQSGDEKGLTKTPEVHRPFENLAEVRRADSILSNLLGAAPLIQY